MLLGIRKDSKVYKKMKRTLYKGMYSGRLSSLEWLLFNEMYYYHLELIRRMEATHVSNG